MRARQEAKHTLSVTDFNSYEAAECTIAKFIHGAVNELWYRDLRHPQLYYTTIMANNLSRTWTPTVAACIPAN